MNMSLPSRGRGLKSKVLPVDSYLVEVVAPFTGAWIEMRKQSELMSRKSVAPFTGAWIEISEGYKVTSKAKVAPFTGAWIEIFDHKIQLAVLFGRSLHGGVD